jgi:hypothetical protein
MELNSPRLVPLNRAARWLHVPLKWLLAEAEAGRIPCLRAGRRILCDLAAVEEVLLQRAGREERPADPEGGPPNVA